MQNNFNKSTGYGPRINNVKKKLNYHLAKQRLLSNHISHSIDLIKFHKINQVNVFFSIVYAIKCYQCNSAHHPECEDVNATETLSITKTFLQNCTGDYEGEQPFCRKIIQTSNGNIKYINLCF